MHLTDLPAFLLHLRPFYNLRLFLSNRPATLKLLFSLSHSRHITGREGLHEPPEQLGASLVLHVPALRRCKTKVVLCIVKMDLAQHYCEPVVLAERLCHLKIYILFHRNA